MEDQTTDRKLIELEFLRRAVSKLEDAVLAAYWRGSHADILKIVDDCVGQLCERHRDECPEGSVLRPDGMCEFPGGEVVEPEHVA